MTGASVAISGLMANDVLRYSRAAGDTVKVAVDAIGNANFQAVVQNGSTSTTYTFVDVINGVDTLTLNSNISSVRVYSIPNGLLSTGVSATAVWDGEVSATPEASHDVIDGLTWTTSITAQWTYNDGSRESIDLTSGNSFNLKVPDSKRGRRATCVINMTQSCMAPNSSTVAWLSQKQTATVEVFGIPGKLNTDSKVRSYQLANRTDRNDKLTVTYDMGTEADWTWSWSTDPNFSSDATGANQNVYTVSNVNPGECTFTATGSYKPSANLTAKPYTANYKIIYVEAPMATYAFESVVFAEDRFNLETTPKGGVPSGWTYTWKKDGTTQSNWTNASIADVLLTENREGEKHTYEVSWVNKYVDTDKGFNETFGEGSYTFNVTVFPVLSFNVSSATSFNRYVGENVLMEVTVKGGLSDEPWNITWSSDEGTFVTKKESLYFQGNEETLAMSYQWENLPLYENGQTFTVQVKATNDSYKQYGANFEKEQKISVTVWNKGRASVGTVSNVDGLVHENIYHGHSHTLTATPNGGYSQGWTYQWYRNEEALFNQTGATYTFTANNVSKDSIFETYSVRCINKLNETVGCDTMISQKYLIYPKATIPMWDYAELGTQTMELELLDVTVEENYVSQMRQNDVQAFVYYQGSGGWKDGWSYAWTNHNGYQFETKPDTVLIVYAGMSEDGEQPGRKRTETADLIFSYTAVGPDGDVWENGSFHHPLTIYRRPQQPSQYVVKGNNTSHIGILMYDNLSDENLDDYEYQFEFGSDSDTQTFVENQRWHQYNGESACSQGWGRSLWVYPDGFHCYSDIRTVKNETRGTTAIENLSVEEDRKILDMSGKVVSNDIKGLPAGTYVLVETKNGQRLSRTIIVK